MRSLTALLPTIAASVISVATTFLLMTLANPPLGQAQGGPATPTPGPRSEPGVAAVVRAERFELLHASGAVRAVLGSDVVPASVVRSAAGLEQRATGFTLQDQAGRARVGLALLDDGGSVFTMLDERGNGRLALVHLDDGSTTMAFGDEVDRARFGITVQPDGTTGAAAFDREGRVRTTFGVANTGAPAISLFDESNRLKVNLGLGTDGAPSFGLLNAAGQPRVIVGVGDDDTAVVGVGDPRGQGVGLVDRPGNLATTRIQDGLGRTRVESSVSADGTPYSTLLAEDGTPLWRAP